MCSFNLRNFLVLAAGLLFSLGADAQAVYDIYPVPHEQQAVQGTCRFTATVSVVADDYIDEPTKARAADVLAEHGLKAEFVKKPRKGTAAVYLGVYGKRGKADKLAAKRKLLTDDLFSKKKYDIHLLSLVADSKGLASLVVLGENTNAVFFGLASLEQMLDRGTAALPCVTIYDYADIKSRGVIEGYYGVPYSAAVTMDLFRFMMRYKMNSYVYGAKSDPYHSRYWDRPYPEKLTDDLQSLGCFNAGNLRDICKVSAATKVNFIWAIHPGKDFTGKDDGVIDRIMGKFALMHGLGVRQFAVFVDDVGMPTDASTLALNATRLTSLRNAMEKKWNFAGANPADTVKELHFVPQLYAYGWQSPEVVTRFFNALSAAPKSTQVYITGKETWSVPNNNDINVVETALKRKVSWWWNYPCNDNADSWIYPCDMYTNFYDMPAIDDNARLPRTLDNCASLLCNPMQEGEIAKIPLFSAADYAWNNAAFDVMKSWNASMPAVVGKEYAEAFKALTPYLRVHDSDELGKMIEAYKQTGDASSLKKLMAQIADNCTRLCELQNSQVESQRLFYGDIHPWILKLRKTAQVLSDLLDIAAMPAGEARSARYAKAVNDEHSLFTSSDYEINALEGMGKAVVKEKYIVKMSKDHLYPFLKYMMNKAK